MTAESTIARREARLRADVAEAAAARARGRYDDFTRGLVDAVAFGQAFRTDMAETRAMILAGIPELLATAAAERDDRAGAIAMRKAWRAVRQRIADRAAALAAARPKHVVADLDTLERDRR